MICKSCGHNIKQNETYCSYCGLMTKHDAVVCLDCHTANPLGSRFCLKCGLPMVVQKKPICHLCGTENMLEAVYCKQCGSVLHHESNISREEDFIEKVEEIIPKIQKIEKQLSDPFVGMSKEQIDDLTYICPICGKLNFLDDSKCARCGRSRRKSAILTAKNFIKSSKDTKAIKDKNIVKIGLEVEEKHKQKISQRTQDDLVPEQEVQQPEPMTMQEYMEICQQNIPNVNGYQQQMAPIIQPIAFVPFVSQEQPLWQVVEDDEEDK